MRLVKVNKYLITKKLSNADALGDQQKVFLKDKNGVYREVYLDTNDNLVVNVVPPLVFGPLPDFLVPSSGSNYTIDFSNGPNQRITLTANCTFAFANPVAGMAYLIFLRQDGGSRSAFWPGSVLWPFSVAPTLATTFGYVDSISLYFNGTNFYGNSAPSYSG